MDKGRRKEQEKKMRDEKEISNLCYGLKCHGPVFEQDPIDAEVVRKVHLAKIEILDWVLEDSKK